MAAELGIGLGALALLVGFPLLMLGVIGVLGWLEAWMLHPYERAVRINKLLEDVDEADELEVAVARLVARVADAPAHRPRERSPRQQSHLRATARRLLAQGTDRRAPQGSSTPSSPTSEVLR